jgi:hypothetical protein
MDFTWDIQPDPTNLESITLDIDYSIAAGDTLLIFSSSGLFNAIALTADTGTFHFDMNIQSVQVRLRTHSSSSEGFRGHYTAHRTVFCNGTNMYSAATGNLTDGSGDAPYNNFTSCKFRIMLSSSYSATHFHINSFDLEEGHDYLHFYNNLVSNANYMFSLTGHISDSDFVVDTRRLCLVLETDEAGRDAGFDIDYSAGHSGVDSHNNDALSLWPNPARDHVTLSCTEPIQFVELRNAEGRIVHSEYNENQEVTIQTSQLSAGIYLMTVHTQTGVFTRKIVKL